MKTLVLPVLATETTARVIGEAYLIEAALAGVEVRYTAADGSARTTRVYLPPDPLD